MLSTQPYKGARDFYPEEKRLQKHIFHVMRTVAERYGYEEYDAPIIEPIELYIAKSAEEIVTEQTYVFEDRGKRTVTLRPEMTPTVSRMVAAKRQELAFPLRWYSIPNVWRYERPQRGRLREHWQLNVDLFGVAGLEGEHEIIQVADAIMNNFKAKRSMYTIKLNSRKFIDSILKDYFKLNDTQALSLIRLIDKMHKLSLEDFVASIELAFTPLQREEGYVDQLISLLYVKKIEELPLPLRSNQYLAELESLMSFLTDFGITNIEFDITLMRGFDYYTDIVFEVFDIDPENNRSMFGGGRYDGLVAQFGVDPVPTVGFAVGDITLQNFLESHELLPELKSETDAYVILIGDVYERAQRVLNDFRNMGLNIAVDVTGRKAAQQIKTASKKHIKYAIFIGEEELKSDQFMLKNLVTGHEERHGPERIVTIIEDRRTK